MRRSRRVWLTGGLVLLVACADREAPSAGPRPSGESFSARALELRLVAPCCWNQTLDVHESELASALRAEIRTRLGRGEASAHIEDDMVRRYGERIRAVPKGRDPRTAVAYFVGLVMLVAGLGLLLLGRHWSRRRAAEEGIVSPLSGRTGMGDEYDAQLDRELQQL